MTDEQFAQFLEAVKPKEKPWLQRMAENMAVTIFTGSLTVCLFLGWHMYVDVTKRLDDLEKDTTASTTVFTDEIAHVKSKVDSISRIWDRIQVIQDKLNELEKDHIEQASMPWMAPATGAGASPFPPQVVPSPAPPPKPSVQQAPPKLVDPDTLFKKLESEEDSLKWKLQQQRKK